jgi:hypothetical protein
MKRQIIKDMTVSEVSSVDRPAQKGARAVLLKRDSSENFSKRACMTTAVDGHQHTLWDDRGNGELNAGETDYVEGHSHYWVRDASGNVIIGMARGHTHELGTIGKGDASMKITNRAELIAAIQKAQGEGDSVTVSTVKAIHKAAINLNAEDTLPADGPLAKAKVPDTEDEDMKALKAKMKRMEKRDALSTELRKHYDGLPDDAARDAFLEKDAAGQQVELEKSTGSDPVVYTTLDGLDIRKSAGEPLIAALKSADAGRREAALEKAHRVNLELEKRAETELKSLGGTMTGKKALLKALDGIEDESLRKAAQEVLTSAAEIAGKGNLFEKRGSGAAAPIEKGSAETQLEKMAQDRAKEKSISFEKAYDEMLNTEDGQKLYAKIIG